MSVEFEDLRLAIVAARYRSLRQAAEVLNLRQSTLSRRITDLEQGVGAVLFERTNGGTRTTVAGREFLAAAKRIIEDTETLVHRVKCRSLGECGRLTIGVHVSLSAGKLRAGILDYHRQFPQVEINLVDGAGEYLMAMVDNSAVDVAFLAEHSRRWDGQSLPVWSERAVVALPGSHPLRDHEAVHWNELERERILVPCRGPGAEVLNLVATRLGSLGVRVQKHDVALDRLLTLVGLGLGVLPALEGATGISHLNVVFRQLRDNDGPTRLAFRAVWRKENDNPTLRPFLDMLRSRYPVLAGDPVVDWPDLGAQDTSVP